MAGAQRKTGDYCHENGESAHEKSKTYEQFAILMLRGAPETHDACRKISVTFIDQRSNVK